MIPHVSRSDFLQRFFGAPNTAWPGADPSHDAAVFLGPFIDAFAAQDERPLILPRRTDDEVSVVYVICWSHGHANRVRPLLEAAVSHNWARFSGRTVGLDPEDPVESAVLDLAGPGTTFLLNPSSGTRGRMWTALKAMLAGLEMRRYRPHALPRPIGQLLWEFEAALSAGQADGSGRILAELDMQGGLSLENLAFLRIRRLSRLGMDGELLAHRSIATIVESEPPPAIRDAVLAAWCRRNITSPLATDDEIDKALSLIRESPLPIGLLVDGDIGIQSSESARVAALVGILRQEERVTRPLLGLAFDLSDALRRRLSSVGETKQPDTEPELTGGNPLIAGPAPVLVQDWVTWFRSLNAMEAAPLSSQDFANWPAPGSADAELAEAIEAASDHDEETVLSAVGPFIECDQFRNPAWRSALSLVQRLLVADRLSPEDQGSLQALVEIILRSGPSERIYAELLEDVQSFASRWVSASFPDPAIDLVDCVAAGPRPDPAAATQFAVVLLEPIWAQRQRVPLALRRVAQMSTDALSLGWDWSLPEAHGGQSADDADAEAMDIEASILLYSLDESVLKRSREVLTQLAPKFKIHCSSDKVATTQLKSHARTADLVVLATRCAKHSATACIVENADRGTIAYADGAGSASMIRAFETAAKARRMLGDVA